MSLFAAHRKFAKRYIIADSLDSVSDLWSAIITSPAPAAARYREIWRGQETGGPEYFYSIRDRYNTGRDPVDLLYLICRCVKNAVRFSKAGAFTQSVDKRRLGMRPDKMEAAILGASTILRGRTEIRTGDWLATTADAQPNDFLYMDPPYLGTSIGPDKRYAEQMAHDRLIDGLRALLSRNVGFALSYDGATGGKHYGPPLPAELGLTRLLLHAGVSSQATLNGRREETIESLYLSRAPSVHVPTVIRKSNMAVLSVGNDLLGKRPDFCVEFHRNQPSFPWCSKLG